MVILLLVLYTFFASGFIKTAFEEKGEERLATIAVFIPYISGAFVGSNTEAILAAFGLKETLANLIILVFCTVSVYLFLATMGQFAAFFLFEKKTPRR